MLQRAYFDAYKKTHGDKEPRFTRAQWPRVKRSFGEIVDAVGGAVAVQEAIQRITNAFADDWTVKNRCQPWDIAKDLNKHATVTTKTNTNGARPARAAGAQPADLNAHWMKDSA
jgi:hypothetical protein